MKKRPCRHPTCTRVVPAQMWGCRDHWFALPRYIRDAISAAYRRGQEFSEPSLAYRQADQAAQDWIRQQGVEA